MPVKEEVIDGGRGWRDVKIWRKDFGDEESSGEKGWKVREGRRGGGDI